MSVVDDFLIDREHNNKELSYADFIFHRIRELYYRDYPNSVLGDSIKSYSQRQKFMEDYFLPYGWERTITGFEKRTNFRYNPQTRELTFDRNVITKVDGKYVPDESEESKKFIKEKSSDFTLMEIYEGDEEEFLNELYMDYKNEIDNDLSRLKAYDLMHKDASYDIIRGTKRCTESYMIVFQELGEKLLIKWLNKLNDTETNIGDLVEEFAEDMDNADQRFFNENYLKYHNFKDAILHELVTYSARGSYFKLIYQKYLKKQEEDYINNREFRLMGKRL